MQEILSNKNNYQQLDEYLLKHQYHNILLVSGKSIRLLKINDYFNDLKDRLNINIHRFDDIKPNPLYESAVNGIKEYNKHDCDCIIAVGGGSPMDIAKCIKLFMYMDDNISYLKQEIIENDIPLIAIPTTAGTGSEATRYAIIYCDGKKVTITHESSIPAAVLFDPSTLDTLADYQKKATMLDALSHAIESYWSKSSNDQSKQYSLEAIKMILDNKDDYLNNIPQGNYNMMQAAYIAGKAINITRTTAGHALCYKLTSLYGISHGHSVALVLSKLFPYIIDKTYKCPDLSLKQQLLDTLTKIADALGCKDLDEASYFYDNLLKELDMPLIESKKEDLDILLSSVDIEKMTNDPIKLDYDDIKVIYYKIISK